MKVFPGFRMLAALALGCAAVTPRADAQFFGLSVSASANPVSTNTSLVYTTVVTNLSSSQFTGVVITNALSPSVQILSVDTSLYSAVTNGNTIVFTVGSLNSGQVAETTITVQPTVAGTLTNTVTVVDTNTFNIAVASLVIQVTNPAALSQADLAVSITGPVQAVITNDYFAYGVLVTNLGPADATGVVLTNSLPPGVRLVDFQPSGLAHTTYGSNEVFALGTLTNGAFKQLSIRVQATNAGTWSFPATVGSARSCLRSSSTWRIWASSTSASLSDSNSGL